ncbi:Cytochrome P450 4V2, partial [Stegodyphus mimosarum]
MEEILSSSVSLEKSFEYSFLHQWLGRGLLTSTGLKWKSRRRLLTPSFHFRILEDFLPVFNNQATVLVKKIRAQADKEYIDIIP